MCYHGNISLTLPAPLTVYTQANEAVAVDPDFVTVILRPTLYAYDGMLRVPAHVSTSLGADT